MPASRIRHEYCQNTFVSNREAVKLNSQAIVTLELPASQQGGAPCLSLPEQKDLARDVWVPRLTCLQIQIDIKFEARLFLRIRNSAQLFECLKRSLVFAEVGVTWIAAALALQ